jgi:serine/threonine protein kinase
MYECIVGRTPFFTSGMSKSDLFRAILYERILPPPGITRECLGLLSGLLKRDPGRRLGSLADGEAGILEHPWFDLDMDLLFLQELEAPTKPKITDPFDVSNFDDWDHVDDKRKIDYPAMRQEEEAIFDGF